MFNALIGNSATPDHCIPSQIDHPKYQLGELNIWDNQQQ
jgi:hypothetical protein